MAAAQRGRVGQGGDAVLRQRRDTGEAEATASFCVTPTLLDGPSFKSLYFDTFRVASESPAQATLVATSQLQRARLAHPRGRHLKYEHEHRTRRVSSDSRARHGHRGFEEGIRSDAARRARGIGSIGCGVSPRVEGSAEWCRGRMLEDIGAALNDFKTALNPRQSAFAPVRKDDGTIDWKSSDGASFPGGHHASGIFANAPIALLAN